MQTPKKITVIMPVYNDVKNIAKNIDRVLIELGLSEHEVDLIVVDDGSVDGTRSVIYNHMVYSDTEFRCVCNPENKGKGYAFLSGVSRAKGEYILLIDSDLQIQPSELSVFFNIMDTYDADVVVGNKRHPYSNIQYTKTRHLISNTYNYICRVLFGIQLRDTQCGFKLFKTKALKSVMDRIKTKRFAFDLELLVALQAKGFRIADAPIYMRKQYNAGSISIGNILQTFKDTISIWLRKKKGFYGW